MRLIVIILISLRQHVTCARRNFSLLLEYSNDLSDVHCSMLNIHAWLVVDMHIVHLWLSVNFALFQPNRNVSIMQAAQRLLTCRHWRISDDVLVQSPN